MTEQNGETLAEFDKNATECVRITPTTFKGIELIDSRVYCRDDHGKWQPSKKGLCLRLECFARLACAAQEVCDKLGLATDSEA